jgi:hypothetical protein
MGIQDKNSQGLFEQKQRGSQMCPKKAAAKEQNEGTESKNQMIWVKTN